MKYTINQDDSKFMHAELMQHTNDSYYPEDHLLDAAVIRSHAASATSPGIIMGIIIEEKNQCRTR
eukprot:4191606-Ditylum_brightwellii.AAC.1